MKHLPYASSLLGRDLNRVAHTGAIALVAYAPFGHSMATLFLAGFFWALVRALGFLIQAYAGPPPV